MELELPMMAFTLNGYGEYICLTIEEVFGFPETTSYGGGYSARGNLKIVAGCYQADSQHYFTTGELYTFCNSLIDCYNKLDGTAELPNTECELTLSVTFNKKFGKVSIEGSFRERPDRSTELKFEIVSDQSNILPAINSLKKVVNVFGDMKGIRH